MDTSEWRLLLHRYTKIVCAERLLGKVKWAAAFATPLPRGCRE